MREYKGQTYLIILVVLLVVLLFIPTGIFIMQDWAGAGDGVKGEEEYFLAHRALREGYEKLISYGSIEELFRKRPGKGPVAADLAIKGYNFDKIYSYKDDNTEGQYMIKIASSSAGGRRIDINVMTRSTDDVFCGLRGAYRQASVMGPLWGNTLNLENNLIVHWGPMYASRRIDAGWHIYPRKFSQGEILHRDSNGIEKPNTDHAEWWSYEVLPRFVSVDLTAIKLKAKKSKKYYSDMNVILNTMVDTEGSAYYFEHNLKINGNLFVNGIIVVKGNLEIDAKDIGIMDVKVPEYAWKEYSLIDTTAKHEYPGDDGFQASRKEFEFDNDKTLGVKGFIYVGGDLILKNNHNIYGAAVLEGEVLGQGKISIFYDQNLEIPVLSKTFIPEKIEKSDVRWVVPDAETTEVRD